MPTYRLIAFDFDGTLADSLPFLLATLGTLAERHGFRHPRPEELPALRALDARGVLRSLGIAGWQVPRLALEMRRAMAADAHAVALFAGVPRMLATLAASGAELALVTSNARGNAERILGDSARHFTYWECGASLFGKRRRLRAVRRLAGCPAQQMAYVGDELRDLAAARAEGIAAVAVGWGYTLPEALAAARPDLLVESVERLARALRG